VYAQSSGPLSAERASQIASLRIVPFCDLVQNTNAACDANSAGRWFAFDRLTDFSLDVNSDGSLLMQGQGPLLNDSLGSAPWKLAYVTETNQWLFQPLATGPRAEVLTGTRVFEGLPAGNFLRLCSANNQCVPYFLATPEGVCTLVSNGQVLDRPLLSRINQLQASNRQVTCP
jgi:hypothetical protein